MYMIFFLNFKKYFDFLEDVIIVNWNLYNLYVLLVL